MSFSPAQDFAALDVSGSWEEGRSLAEKILEKDSTQAEAWYWKGIFQGRTYHPRSAMRALDRAASLAAPLPDPFRQQIELARWEHLIARNRGPEAEALLAQLKPLAVSFPPALKARWLFLQARHQKRFQKKGPDYRTQLDAALAATDEMNPLDPGLKGAILREIANYSKMSKGVEYGLTFYQEELRVYEEHYAMDHMSRGIPHYNIAGVYYELGEYEKALHHYQSTHALWRKTGAPRKPYMRFLYEGLADMHLELGYNDSALHYYDLSVEGERVVNNDQGASLLQQGDTLASIGKYEAAFPYYQKALDWRLETFGKGHPLTGACNNFLARTYQNRGDLDAALASYQQSLQMLCPGFESDRWQDHPPLTPHPGSEHYFFMALKSKGEILLAKYHQTQDPVYLTEAWEIFDLCVQWFDQLRLRPLPAETKLYWSEQAFPAYELAIETAFMQHQSDADPRWMERAFMYAEKSKAFLLLEAAQESEARHIAGVPSSWLEEEARIEAGIREYSAKSLREEQRCQDARQSQLQLWRAKLIELQQAYEAYLTRVKESFPTYFELKFQVNVLEVAEIQEKLADSTLLLHYFQGDKHLYVFALDRRKLSWHRISQTDSLTAISQRFYQLLGSPQAFLGNPQAAYEQYLSQASTLGASWVTPMLEARPHAYRNLIIIPDGQLSRIPFEALLLGKKLPGAGRNYAALPYLIRDYAVQYSPSASLLYSPAFSQGKGRKSWLGIAPDYKLWPKAHAGWQPLRYSETEVRHGLSQLRGKALLGPEASETHFREYASQARVLHLAAHATIDDQAPALSHFVLMPHEQEDGLLHTYELYGLPLAAELAILSACNTGAGTYLRGEGMMSLGRAFHFAGCPSLITSLWQVDDRSTEQLMAFLYEELAAGKKKEDALRAARLRYLDTADATHNHPFFWAGFVLMGKGGHLSKGNDRWLWWLVGGLLLTGLGLGLYRWRKSRQLS
ncbi:MAG: CHAT domain-containing tetratricopeptide repeat protein [Bacteroidota bacterium]